MQLIFHRDIAAGAVLDMMSMVETQFGLVKWVDQHAELKRYCEMLEARELQADAAAQPSCRFGRDLICEGP